MKPTLRALALLAPLAGPVLSSGGDPADDLLEWPDLDSTIERLASSLAEEEGAPHFWGYLRPLYANNDISGSDQGFYMDSIRLNAEGDVSGYDWRVSIEGNSDEPLLNDAYIRIPLLQDVTTTWGLFKKPVLRSGLIEANQTLFLGRTRNGLLYSVRDWGVQITQKKKGIELTCAAQNGADTSGDDALLTGRIDLDIFGGGRLEHEGAFGTGRKQRLNAGYAWSDDRESDRGRARAFDIAYVHKRWSLSGEVVRYDSGYNVAPKPFDGQFAGSTTPWTWTASYMLCTHCTEIALRFEDLSDPLRFDGIALRGERTRTILGLNHYISGHDFKWQVNYGKFEEAGGETDWAAIGLTLSF